MCETFSFVDYSSEVKVRMSSDDGLVESVVKIYSVYPPDMTFPLD